MSITIERRIAKLEEEILPKPVRNSTVLMEPQRDADPEVVAAYLVELAQARRNEDNIIVVRLTSPGWPEREDVADVRYVNTEWEAQLAILASQPSELGNKSRLDDFMKSLSGNVLGVSKVTVDEMQEDEAA